MQKYLKLCFSTLLTVCSLNVPMFANEFVPSSEHTPDHLLSQAHHLIKNKQYQDALEILDHSIETFPDHVNSIKTRANVYFLENKDELALQDFEKRADLHPDDPDSYIDLAVVLYRMKRYEAALAYAEHALQMKPMSPFAFKVKMLILKETDKAKKKK